MRRFYYLTCCVDSTAAAIDAMTEAARTVSYQTIRRHCADLREFERNMTYDTGNQRGGLRLKDDWHVSYHRSKYRGRRCYYIRHSAIEYIWTER